MSEARRRLQTNVVRAREHKQWSQRTLAERARVAVDTVQKLEAGRTSVTLGVLERIATALEVSVVTLLSDEGQGTPPVGWQALPEPERAFVLALVGYFQSRTGGA